MHARDWGLAGRRIMIGEHENWVVRRPERNDISRSPSYGPWDDEGGLRGKVEDREGRQQRQKENQAGWRATPVVTWWRR